MNGAGSANKADKKTGVFIIGKRYILQKGIGMRNVSYEKGAETGDS